MAVAARRSGGRLLSDHIGGAQRRRKGLLFMPLLGHLAFALGKALLAACLSGGWLSRHFLNRFTVVSFDDFVGLGEQQ
jgi:hypothetical protein